MDNITSFDYYSEFKNYAQKHLGVSAMQFHYWDKLQDRIYSPNASMTPYILEERELRVTQMDIFSRLMMDRILWVAGPVNDNMSTIVQAQLMFLDQLNQNEFIELVNPDQFPVKLSGASLSDSLNLNDKLMTIPDLSFIGPNSYAAIKPRGFKLSTDFDQIVSDN